MKDILRCAAVLVMLLLPALAAAESDRDSGRGGDFFSRIWDPAYRDLLGKRAAADIRLAEDPPAAPFRAAWLQSFGTNIRINDPTGDFSSETQSETAVAAFGSRVIAGWNDSKGFTVGTISSYGYSVDGGLTWTDGGDLPRNGLGAGEQIYGDPGLAADRHGNFYFCSLYFMPGGVSAIGVNRGTFLGGSPVWQPPVAIAPTLPDFQDKCAIGCDPDSPYVYVVWTRFFGGAGEGQMEFARSRDGGVTFDPEMVLKPVAPGINVESGYVVVDEVGGVNIFWEDGLAAPIGTGQHSYILHRRSIDRGASFGAIDTAATIAQNWLAAPPGFNRRDGFFEFPSAAVDKSNGPNRGTIYLTFNEACEPVFSGVGPGTVSEVETNNTVATAMPISVPRRVTGTISSGSDVDFYSFSGTAGQMVRVTVTPQDTLYPWLRLSNAPAGDTLLIDSRNGKGLEAYGWVTLPSTGTYTIQVQPRDNTTAGPYSMDVENVTAGAGSVARDHRDAVACYSRDHGAHWSKPALVNDDPPLFDNCMPDVAVDSLGYVHIFWYDRRNDLLRGGRADVYYARSSNGGLSWSPNLRITDGATTWQVPSRSAPNFGDYSNATSAGNTTWPIFADGRGGTPDAYAQPVYSGFQVSCASDTNLSHGDTLSLRYTVTNLSPFPETFVYDVADSSGLLSAVRDSVAVGANSSAQVTYRKIVPDSLHASYNDPVTLTGRYRSAYFATSPCRAYAKLHGSVVAVEGGARLDTRFELPYPSPSAGRVHLRFSLARRGPVSINAYDVSGRRVAQLAEGNRAPGAFDLNWNTRESGSLTSGVYFVRAELAGETITRRVVVLR